MQNTVNTMAGSIRRVVEGIIAKTDCSRSEAIQETALAFGINVSTVHLAIDMTDKGGWKR